MKLTDPRVKFKEGRPYVQSGIWKRYLEIKICPVCDESFYKRIAEKNIICGCRCAKILKPVRFWSGKKRNNIAKDKHYLWKGDKIEKFIQENQKKHLCKCDCGEYIVVARHHYWHGIPEFLHGHHQKGEANKNWKGGITLLSQMIRSSGEYGKWRRKIFERDFFTCQECGYKGHDIEAHHLMSFAEIYNEFLKEYDQFSPIDDKETLMRLAFKYKPFWGTDSGNTLCIDCHKKTRHCVNKTEAGNE